MPEATTDRPQTGTTRREPTPPPPAQEGSFSRMQWIGAIVGPLLFVIMLLSPAPEDLPLVGWRVAAATVLIATWWVTEVIPISATALLPLVLFPVLGIETMNATAAPYAAPMIFLFLGGFIIALGMQRWGLHRRIALNIIKVIGTHPSGIIAGFMVASALLSMWVSNTATTMMMLPIGLSVIELARPSAANTVSESESRAFGISLMLAIAYASSVGGLGTLVGTPTNALVVAFMSQTYGFEISFVEWMMVGVPMVVVILPITHFVLTRLAFPLRLKSLPGGREYIDSELIRLGAMSKAEKLVAFVFGLTATLWVFQPLISGFIPGLSDTSIAIFCALLLFLIPVNLKKGEFLMTWKYAERLPWGVLILFGSGLTLAGAIQRSGLAEWIGGYLDGIGGWPVILVIALMTAVIIFFTELASNSATAAAFLPILASVMIGIGENPLLVAVPVAIAASCAFMLPVATPPNAIVYGSGIMTIPQMARAGFLLNLACIVVITALTYTLVVFLFGIEIGVVPEWAVSAVGTVM